MTPAEPGRIVLFIAGAGRSGSTLLNALLGQSPDVVALGELRYLWERGILAGRECSCGRPVAACPLWAGVVARTRADRVAASAMTSDLDGLLRVRGLIGLRRAGARRARDRASARIEDLYRALEEVTGRLVFVDSSKRPAWGTLLARLHGVDLRVVHLVRDPRATVWSWQRRKPLADGGPPEMQRIAPWRATALWALWNVTTEMLLRRRRWAYRLVTYERLVREPAAVVGELLEWANLAPAACFEEPGVVRLAPLHAIAGNADRSQQGRVEIRADDEWQHRMPRHQQVGVGLLTYPLRRRYLAGAT